MGCDWSMCQNLSTWDVFWMDQADFCVSCTKKPYLKHTTDGAIDQSGGNDECHLL